MMNRSLVLLTALLTSALLPPWRRLDAQQTPTAAAAPWWTVTTALANDGMEGRDTGSAGYERAAKYVAEQFKRAGLEPAGDNGTYFQRVPMHEIDLDTAHSSMAVLHYEHPGAVGAVPQLTPVTLVEEATLTPFAGSLDFEGGLVFLGYAGELPPPATLGLKSYSGQAAVVFSGTPAGLPEAERLGFAGRRARLLAAAGFAVVVSVDNPAALEPFHWPAAYSRSVTLAGTPPAPTQPAPTRTAPTQARTVQLRISAEAAGRLFAHDPGYPALLADGEAGRPLLPRVLHDGLSLHLRTTVKEISSPNVLGVLPGANPALAGEYVALSAHLDGYGYGTPVHGDTLYNGALDDAAYVATLIDLADRLHRVARLDELKGSLAQSGGSLQPDPNPSLTIGSGPGLPTGLPQRSLLFAAFTGEEKGLLGSAWFTQHPTVPAGKIVADLNLDQLRPIFPLRILTMEGLDESSLGATVRAVAARFAIEIRGDREPERNLFRRADNFNFVRIGVPVASFIFGYDPGTPEERIYRDWYARRYHKPQDDLSTPIDWAAAVKFNSFYRALALTVADAPERPAWMKSSQYVPKP